MKNKINFSLIFLSILLFSKVGKSQISIINIPLQAYNISPESMIAATIMNNSNAQPVQLISRLYNFNNELLLTVQSSSINLKSGLNSPFDGNRKVSSSEYTTGNQSQYIKTTHGLPSGTFKICIDIIQAKTLEPIDQYCDEIESDFNQYLYLVYPSDKDTIETTTPLLVWSHSEPFSILTQGEYYRMIVSEVKKSQGPDEAVTINSPLMANSYLTSHDLQYPYDAKELKEGGDYAWQVQKISNGVIINQTEAWEFFIAKKTSLKDIKYVALKQKVDANFYTAVNGKIYFKFVEQYNSNGNILAILRADSGKEIPVSIVKDDINSNVGNSAKLKIMGDNRFILDLEKKSVKKGFYTIRRNRNYNFITGTIKFSNFR